ncbi:hypothetical protein H0A36_17375 [Endozoicomonas sp. SM1973]|uniref:Uncharacterized protein n=1 Tax=Spartinivicinus marinus TaxID=2994442 RepID=A0A853IE53_9GAMM|nr:hypothetical protein [Spartinivicinus marinus]MCX4030144.1 hypothetical protein [Spartinivicinus marinus]NYZ67787.1 hypothetical protein [Spartinivicinus marinus]
MSYIYLVFCIILVVSILLYIFRDRLNAFIKGQPYREYLEQKIAELDEQIELVKSQISTEDKGRAELYQPNFLTNFRDNYWGAWPRTLLVITVTILGSIGLAWISYLFGFGSKPSLFSLLPISLGVLSMMGLAYLINKRWPN